MLPNGPAIKGGCVTRRKHRVGSWYQPEGAKHGAVFAIQLQVF